MRKTTLLALAAGMGSRFGGLKQMTPVADNGRVLLDFSVYDAIASGFDKIVFVIKEEMYQDFKQMIGDRIQNAEVDYVFQEMESLPEGRVKPWGTAHALLCCRDKIDTPFAVINADDYYGIHAYQEIHNHLVNAENFDFAMVAFDLKNTLSESGTVARGVCQVENGYLRHITELTKINKDFQYTEDEEHWVSLPEDTVVSMNLWGFTPKIFDVLDKQFADFLKNTPNPLKDEFFIPLSVEQLIKDDRASVKVYNSRDKWYGMTYADDLPSVRQALNQLVQEGYYNGL